MIWVLRKITERAKKWSGNGCYSLLILAERDKERMILRYPRTSNLVVDKELAFDVGSFIGTSLPRLREIGYSKVVCFEPSSTTFRELYKKQRHDQGVSFVNRAVSDVSGKRIPFYENIYLPTLNTTSEAWIKETRHKKLIPDIKKTFAITITLDEAIRLIGAIPGYIKIDVEGHELSALRGLSHKTELLSFEWISERTERNKEVLARCVNLGFKDFYLAHQEAVPTYDPSDKMSADELLEKWSTIRASDTENSAWGNIWCK